MATMYGYDVEPHNDRFVHLAEEAIEKGSSAMMPGSTIVNAIPSLRKIPSWVPVPFWRMAKNCKKLTADLLNIPYEDVKAKMVSVCMTGLVVEGRLTLACRRQVLQNSACLSICWRLMVLVVGLKRI